MLRNDPIVLRADARHSQAVRFLADGATLLSCGLDRHVKLWRVGTWVASGALEGHTGSANSLSLTPDERLLATGSSDKTVRIWSLDDRRTVAQLPKADLARFSPDGQSLAVRHANGRVALHAGDGYAGQRLLPRVERKVCALAWDPAGQTLWIAGSQGVQRLDAETGEGLDRPEGLDGWAVGLRRSPDGRVMLGTAADGRSALWSATDGALLHAFEPDGSGPPRVAWSPDGRRFVAGTAHRIAIRSADDGTVEESTELPVKGVYGVAWSSDGRHVANAAADGRVRVWSRR